MSDELHIGYTMRINMKTGEHTLKADAPSELAAPTLLNGVELNFDDIELRARLLTNESMNLAEPIARTNYKEVPWVVEYPQDSESPNGPNVCRLEYSAYASPVEVYPNEGETFREMADSIAQSGWDILDLLALVKKQRAALEQIATGQIAGDSKNHKDALAIIRQIASEAI